MAFPALQAGSGFVESIGQVAVLAGTLVLVLMLVALGAFAYKSLRGDGIRWPDEDAGAEDDVHRGDADDEWDYY